MSVFLRQKIERLGLMAALLVFVASGTWAWVRRARADLPGRFSHAGPAGGAAVSSLTSPPGEAVSPIWERPTAQPEGPEWVYELFTPPAIAYDPETRTFRVVPPVPPEPAPAMKEPAFAPELLSVAYAPYRLQLVGYEGTPGDYRGFFVRPNTSSVFVARPGRRIPEAGLLLTDLTLVEAPAGSGELVAVADLRDERTGAEVQLDNRTRAYSRQPQAVVRVDGRQLEVREDEIFGAGENEYRVERLQVDPPEAEIARLDSQREPVDTRVLQPEPAGDDRLAPDFALRPGKLAGAETGVASVGQGP